MLSAQKKSQGMLGVQKAIILARILLSPRQLRSREGFAATPWEAAL